jgi:DNA polymerase III epsilon subunit-like protein
VSKVLAFDVETTGLDSSRHDIIQLAMLMIIDHKVVDRGVFYMRPRSVESVDPQALTIHGLGLDTIMEYERPMLVHQAIVNFLGEHIDKYDTTDKAYPLAFRADFDISFLKAHFEACKDPYMGSWVNTRMALDPLPLFRLLDYWGVVALPNYKLGTLAKHFDIELQAHDALSDIEATWALFEIAGKLLSNVTPTAPVPVPAPNMRGSGGPAIEWDESLFDKLGKQFT